MIKQLTNAKYQAHDGLSHSELMLLQNSPADLIWSKNAPIDTSKTSVFDFGTAVHTALLEPLLMDKTLHVSGFKGRTTQGFLKDVAENPDKIVLTESEVEQLQIMVASCKAHPTFNFYMNLAGNNENSIFAEDKERGIMLKCRADRDCAANIMKADVLLCDVKTTASLDDWRSDKEWINPLFKYGYGLQACHYLNVASLHYGFEINKFVFLVLSKSASFGRYPVGVFEIRRDELETMGFWQQYQANLDTYAECKANQDWISCEHFNFGGEQIEITEIAE